MAFRLARYFKSHLHGATYVVLIINNQWKLIFGFNSILPNYAYYIHVSKVWLTKPTFYEILYTVHLGKEYLVGQYLKLRKCEGFLYRKSLHDLSAPSRYEYSTT